eukprot:1161201-Pelagomonas_calceolata.AAC.13
MHAQHDIVNTESPHTLVTPHTGTDLSLGSLQRSRSLSVRARTAWLCEHKITAHTRYPPYRD